MKSFLFIFLAFNLTNLSPAFARPHQKHDFVAISESFGPRISTQTIETAKLPLSGILAFTGERGATNRLSFDYNIQTVVFVFADGSEFTLSLNKWFSRQTYVSYEFSSPVVALKVTAQHDDVRGSSSSHRISVYSVSNR